MQMKVELPPDCETTTLFKATYLGNSHSEIEMYMLFKNCSVLAWEARTLKYNSKVGMYLLACNNIVARLPLRNVKSTIGVRLWTVEKDA